MNPVAWKAWYRGGAMYCSDAGGPLQLPRDGCLGVAVLCDPGDDSPVWPRRISHSADWYWHCELDGVGTWCEGNRAEYPTEESILARYPDAYIIRGQWTSDAEMDRVGKLMANWER